MDKKTLMGAIGNHVRCYRLERRLTQAQLAALVDKNNSAITRIESGIRMMSVPLLCELANALNVSCDALVKGPTKSTRIENINLLLRGQSEESLAHLEHIIHSLLEEYGDNR